MPDITVSLRSPISPNCAFQVPDISVEAGGKLFKMRLLAFLASHAIGLAVDLYRYLCHRGPNLSGMALAVEHGPDGFHGRDEPAGDLAVDLLQPVGAEFGLIELLGKPRAIGVDTPHLAFHVAAITLALEAHVERIVQTAERLAKLLDCCPNCFPVGHKAFTGTLKKRESPPPAPVLSP
ncbi:MAG: hypothetical protein U5M53_02225 [Rhodoferax sp.]|nr:hypothetical protein [Rhodoferax sp.]